MPETALIIDDEAEDQLLVAKQLLKKYGYQYEATTYPSENLWEILEKKQYALYTVDGLHGACGEVIDMIRSINPSANIVLVSGNEKEFRKVAEDRRVRFVHKDNLREL